jgi:mono/diheme cytochrome c family protein
MKSVPASQIRSGGSVEVRDRLPLALALGALFMLSLPLAASAQPALNGTRWGQVGPGTMASIERHHRLLSGIPAPYGSMRDRSGYSQNKLLRGAAVFADKCAGCHGSNAQGNGTVARTIYPHPANLSWLAQPSARQAEPYMYWSIAEGGAQFGSDMPAFKAELSRNDIWAVIAYVRSDFRGASGGQSRPARQRK